MLCVVRSFCNVGRNKPCIRFVLPLSAIFHQPGWGAVFVLLLAMAGLFATTDLHAADGVISFLAVAREDASNTRYIEVTWETSREPDITQFELYRSTNSGSLPGTLIDSKDPLGNNQEGASYKYDDKDVVPGQTYYYTLAAKTAVGQSTFSANATINANTPTSTATPTATPTGPTPTVTYTPVATPTRTRTPTATTYIYIYSTWTPLPTLPATITRMYTNTPDPTPTPIPPTITPVPLPTETLTPTPSPLPPAFVTAPTPDLFASALEVPTPIPSVVPQAMLAVDTATATPTATNTSTPEATLTPSPSPTAQPAIFAPATISPQVRLSNTESPAPPAQGGRNVRLALILGGASLALATALGGALLAVWRSRQT